MKSCNAYTNPCCLPFASSQRKNSLFILLRVLREPFHAVRYGCHTTIELLLFYRAALDFLLNILFHGCVDFLFLCGMRAVVYLLC